jgi:glycosyltransferase involved in cell wall biosynthesis
MTLRIDVVIPTRDREHLLARVVGPLLDDPEVNRVVLVDDAARPSGAELPDWIAARADRIELVVSGGVGPAKARQAGAERAQAEVLLFLDDDVVPDAGIAARHLRHHEAVERLVVCGYTPVVPRPGARLSGEAEVYGRTYEDRCAQYDADPHVVLTHLWGGNFSLRRDDALRVGLASEHYGQPCHEDRDFGLRCLEAGMSAVFDRGIRARHEYERAWPRVGEESCRRGYGVVLLHELHGAVIGPFDERQFERGLPRPVAAIVHAATVYRAGRLISATLHVLRWLGARLRLRQVELGAIRLLRRIEAGRGVRAALDGVRARTPLVDG